MDFPARRNSIRLFRARKMMYKVFCGRRGILLIDCLTRDETVNAERYCETLQKLRRVIQKKRRVMPSTGVVLLHVKALPHTARRSTHLKQDFCWEVFNHPPYSPDLAPSDFHLLSHLKKFLYGQHQSFQIDRETEMSVNTVFPNPGGRLLLMSQFRWRIC